MKKILGVKVDNLNKQEILAKIDNFLDTPGFKQIATINPEFVLKAKKDKKFQKILNSCDLNVADGVGIWLAFLRFGSYLKSRVTGVRLSDYILRKTAERNLSVFLACKKRGLSTFGEVKGAIYKKYPKIRIEGADLDIDNIPQDLEIDQEVLLCNFGAPEQEIFIRKQKNDRIKIAIGVGGTFDFWSGKIKRAPKLMRKIGIEWMWRLLRQPRRFGRIFRSVIIFPTIIIFNKKRQ